MPTQPGVLPLPELVPEQEHLVGYIPTVMGPVEFREWKQQLERIDEILEAGGVEETFQRLSLARRNEEEQRRADAENRPFRSLSAVEQASYQRLSSQALRCNVARTLTGESFRDFGCRLAESMLLQRFCKLDRIDAVRIPGKSALQRYSQWLTDEEMRKVIDMLTGAASGVEEGGRQPLELNEALSLEAYFSGHHVRETAHSLSGGLGVIARCGAHVDESDDADPQARSESADGGAGGIP